MDRVVFLKTLLFFQKVELDDVQRSFNVKSLFQDGECCFEICPENVLEFSETRSKDHPVNWPVEILISVDEKQREPAGIYFKLDEQVFIANHTVISQVKVDNMQSCVCIVISWPGIDMRMWLKDTKNDVASKKLQYVVQTMQSVLTAEVLCLKNTTEAFSDSQVCSTGSSTSSSTSALPPYRTVHGDLDHEKMTEQVEKYLDKFTSILDECDKLLDPCVSQVNRALALTTCMHIDDAIRRSKFQHNSTAIARRKENWAAIDNINRIFLESLITSEEFQILKDCFDLYLKELEKKLSVLLDQYCDSDLHSGESVNLFV
jgi:hypothetical protein